MPDDLTDRIGRLPSTLPPRAWTPPAELRRVGRYRRRRRLAVVSLAVVVAIVGGTGLGLKLVQPAAAPIGPGTPTDSSAPVPVVSLPARAPELVQGPVPASVMLVDADLPDGYQVTDQVERPPLAVASGAPFYTVATTCPAFAGMSLEALGADRYIRYHSYYVDHDHLGPRIDETVIRFESSMAMLAAKAQLRALVGECAGPPDPAADWFAFVLDPVDSPPQYWIIAGVPGWDLLAVVRAPEPMPLLGPRAVARLVS